MSRASRASCLNNLCVLCPFNFYVKEAESEPSPPLRPGRRKPSDTSLQRGGGGEGRRGASKVKHNREKEEEEDAFSWNPNPPSGRAKKADKGRYTPERLRTSPPRRWNRREWSSDLQESGSGQPSSSSYEELNYAGRVDKRG